MTHNNAQYSRYRLCSALFLGSILGLSTFSIINFPLQTGQLYPSAAGQQPPANQKVDNISITLFGERYVYIVWITNNTEGSDYEVIFRSSNDNGTTFREPINLSNSTGIDSVDAQITARGRNVYVVWWEIDRNDSAEPVFIASHDFGQTFGQPIKLMNGSIFETLPASQNDTAKTGNTNTDVSGLTANITRNEIITSIPSSDGNFTFFGRYQ